MVEVLQGCHIASAYNILGSAVRRLIMLVCLHTTHACQCAVQEVYSVYRIILNYTL